MSVPSSRTFCQEKFLLEKKMRQAEARAAKAMDKAETKAQRQRLKQIAELKAKTAQSAKQQRRVYEHQEKVQSKRRVNARKQALRVAKRIQREIELREDADELCVGDLDSLEDTSPALTGPASTGLTETNQEAELRSSIPKALNASPTSPTSPTSLTTTAQEKLPLLSSPPPVFGAPLELFLGRSSRRKVEYRKPIVYGLKAPKSKLVVKPSSNIRYGNLLYPTPKAVAKMGHKKSVHYRAAPKSGVVRRKVAGPEGRFLQPKHVVLDLSSMFSPLSIRGLQQARRNTYGYMY